ncbi:MAG: hypothetical protein GXO79_08235 [Chlorobi bacterium]|nr:hypothetical protein [Chlorobiota bacterium]
MKRIIIILFIVKIAGFILLSCKKEATSSVNIVLYDKPLATIQHYIQGKWKFVYGKGGFCGTCLHYCDSCFIEFTPDNRVLVPNRDGTYSTDTTIEWVRDIGTYTNNDSTYLMKFYDKNGYPNIYVIERIYHDTLIYHDNSSDAIFYHYIRYN